MYGTYREFVSPRPHRSYRALVMTIRYPSREICDKDFGSVQSGSAAGFSRLDKLLST
jgi:hypothetical protein